MIGIEQHGTPLTGMDLRRQSNHAHQQCKVILASLSRDGGTQENNAKLHSMPKMPTLLQGDGTCPILFVTIRHHPCSLQNTQVNHQQHHTRYHHQHAFIGPPPALHLPGPYIEASHGRHAPARSPTCPQESDLSTISDRMGTHARRLSLHRMDPCLLITVQQHCKKRHHHWMEYHHHQLPLDVCFQRVGPPMQTSRQRLKRPQMYQD
jgi:hypothetical protein